jgi:hypothetical protein
VARGDIDEQISNFSGAKQSVRIIREWKENGSNELKSETRLKTPPPAINLPDNRPDEALG